MTARHRILTPAAASVVAGVLVTVAAIGGAMGAGGAAAKTDRFAALGETLCSGAQLPNISGECLAWTAGAGAEGAVRYVTVASTDAADGVTTLIRLKATPVAY